MRKKAAIFTIDAVLALFILMLFLSSYAALYDKEISTSDTELSATGQGILLSMEKTGVLIDLAKGKKSNADAEDFINSSLLPWMAAEFNLSTYENKSGGFEEKRFVTASVGKIAQPRTMVRRVGYVNKASGQFTIAQLIVGMR